MNEILQWIGCWFILGIVGWIAGTILDYLFYDGKKPEWKMIFLCTVLGPIIWLVMIKVLTDTWMDIRKKKPKNKIPKNLEECFTFLDNILSNEDKEKARKDPEFGRKVHHSLGRMLRNDWYLWRGGKLKDYFNELGIWHADDMSGIILTSYHRHLNGDDLKLYEQVRSYIEYWEKENGKG